MTKLLHLLAGIFFFVLWGTLPDNCFAQDIESAAKNVTALSRAHAHNDYLHDRPLLDALDAGFTSVEADVFLVDEDLLVAHTPLEWKSQRTLKNLYLDPLAERAKANGGWIYQPNQTLTLLVDIKMDAERTYKVLTSQLSEYPSLISSTVDGKYQQRAVTVIISGARPREFMAKQTHRLAGLDGRMGDLESDATADFLPLISDNWSNHFAWRGKGDFPVDQRKKLQQIVHKAHAAKRRVRFWAAPDNQTAWQAQLDAGVDLINTDKLNELAEFLRAKESDQTAKGSR